MRFEFYICDDAGALLAAKAQLRAGARILHETPIGGPDETGKLKSFTVGAEISAAKPLESYTDKFILLAEM